MSTDVYLQTSFEQFQHHGPLYNNGFGSEGTFFLNLLLLFKCAEVVLVVFVMEEDALSLLKIIKANLADPDEHEKKVSQAILDLELNSELKTSLRELYITSVREIEVGDKKSKSRAVQVPALFMRLNIYAQDNYPLIMIVLLFQAYVIFVPVPQLKAFQTIQATLVRELEKKFNGTHVVFVAQRRILPKPTRKANKLKQKRPRSRKRTRIRLDGSRLFKIHLDKTQQTNIEHKTGTFAAVYKKLTGKEVSFEFPEAYL
ncbi:40S ribosomal protein S7 [Caligus rogercresseyi]|uniref:40S ribosomal protein S7 n=1 Tax=Caligus rogercresseyi TaxID=217165 RepID=A0A7T8QWM0_CALRO|nr:40S ribosomal protein S7 [Caligus rogercresseyi]